MRISHFLNAKKEYELTKKRVDKYNREVLKNFKRVTPYHFRKFHEEFGGALVLEKNKLEFINNDICYTVRYIGGKLHLDNLITLFIEDNSYPILMDK